MLLKAINLQTVLKPTVASLQTVLKPTVASLFDPIHPAVVSIGGLQAIRWKQHRKPYWKGTAPSKEFRVTGRKRLPTTESQELFRIRRDYLCKIRCIENYLEEVTQVDKHEEDERIFQEQFAHHKQMMLYNDEENTRVAALRKDRLRLEWLEQLKEIDRFKMMKKKEEEEALEKGLKLIADTQEIVKHLIGLEDLENAIEAAMANPTDLNTAIGLHGHIYRGRFTKPLDIEEEDKEVMEEFTLKTSDLVAKLITDTVADADVNADTDAAT